MRLLALHPGYPVFVISLLLKHWKTALLAGAVLTIVLSVRQCQHEAYERGRAEVLIKVRNQEVALLKVQADSLSKHFARDTVRLTRLVTRWDTVKQTDTLTRETIIAVADSTIKACQITVTTCARALAAKDSVIARQDSLARLRISRAEQHTTFRERLGLCAGYGLAGGQSASVRPTWFIGACLRFAP